MSNEKISVDEIFAAHKEGKLDESFGTGTAAVISPVGQYIDGEEKIVINNGEIGEISQKLYDNITSIQWGKAEDPMGWTVVID